MTQYLVARGLLIRSRGEAPLGPSQVSGGKSPVISRVQVTLSTRRRSRRIADEDLFLHSIDAHSQASSFL